MTAGIDYREKVLNLIRDERARQDGMYQQANIDLPMGFGGNVPAYPWLTPFSDADNGRIEASFRADYEEYVILHGRPTWMHLIREEVAELFDTHASPDTIGEAVQVAALCVSLCEQLLANRGKRAEKE